MKEFIILTDIDGEGSFILKASDIRSVNNTSYGSVIKTFDSSTWKSSMDPKTIFLLLKEDTTVE